MPLLEERNLDNMRIDIKSARGKLLTSFPFFVVLWLLGLTGVAQSSELGAGFGGFKYSGDLARGISIKSIKPSGTIFYRSNISDAVSFRAAISAGGLTGSDSKTPIDPFAEQRNQSFNVFLLEASTVFEYHFLKWRDPNSINRWTPYFFGGFAIFGLSGMGPKPVQYSNLQPALPFGFGFKYVLNPKWYLGAEFGARKTFFDYLDNLGDGDGTIKNFDYGNRFDNDHYYSIGLSLTYSFYVIPCPTSPYRKNYRDR